MCWLFLKRHKTMKHKDKVPPQTSSQSSIQPDVPCVRQEFGCKNTVNKYNDRNTAICPKCKVTLDTLMKSSPFPSTMCPCCHATSTGPPFSFCQECLGFLAEDGSMDSTWGTWVLERNTGKIICMHLDFTIP